MTDETSRKPVTGETSRKPVTGDNVTDDTIGKPVTTTYDPAGPDWLQIGSITLKDEEKSILYLPNRIIDVTQEMFIFFKKSLNPKRKKKKIISLLTAIQFLKSEAATTVRISLICFFPISK